MGVCELAWDCWAVGFVLFMCAVILLNGARPCTYVRGAARKRRATFTGALSRLAHFLSRRVLSLQHPPLTLPTRRPSSEKGCSSSAPAASKLSPSPASLSTSPELAFFSLPTFSLRAFQHAPEARQRLPQGHADVLLHFQVPVRPCLSLPSPTELTRGAQRTVSTFR